MLNITSSPIVHKCNRCGSKLVLLKKKKQKLEGYSSPVTISVFKCSDKICQASIDKDLNQLKKETAKNMSNDAKKGNRVNLRLKKSQATA